MLPEGTFSFVNPIVVGVDTFTGLGTFSLPRRIKKAKIQWSEDLSER